MAKKKTKAEPELGRHVLVAVGKIELSKRPNRVHIDQKSGEFKELVASVKATGGILQPLLVRPHAKRKDTYELVAGERRLSATKAAGRAAVPCMVRKMTDEQAAAFQLTENVHREDLKPLEEAAQIRAMLDAGFVTKEIANLLGRTPRFVQRRASLTGLSGKWSKSVAAGKGPFAGWPSAALEKIARLPEDVQDALYGRWARGWQGEGLRSPTPDPKQFEKAIGDLTHELKRARWKLDDAALVPKAGACLECRKRAGQQPLLWEGLTEIDMTDPKASKEDVCVDAGCWGKKLDAELDRRKKELRKEHPDLILIATTYNGNCDHQGSVREYIVAAAKKGAKGAHPALVVDGPRAGSVRWVKPSSSFGGPVAGMTRGPSPLKERRKKLADRRESWVIDEIQKALHLFGFAELEIDDTEADSVILRLVATFGTTDLGGTFDQFKQSANEDWASLYEDLWGSVKHNIPCETMPYAEPLAEFLGLDVAELKAKALRELPEPKSWSALKEDGTPKSAATRAKERKKAAPAKVKRAKFTPAAGVVMWNTSNVCTDGYEKINIPIRKTAKGKLTIKVVQHDGKWYASQKASCDPGAHSSPLSLTGGHYKTREFAILGVLREEAACSQCGEQGSKAAEKRARMMTEDIKAFLAAAEADATYLRDVVLEAEIERVKKAYEDPKKPEPKDGPSPLVCRGCGCSEGNACMTDDGPCHWAIPPGTPLAKEKGPLCSACDGDQPAKRKKAKKRKAKKAKGA